MRVPIHDGVTRTRAILARLRQLLKLELLAQEPVYFNLLKGPPSGNRTILLSLLLFVHVVTLVAVHQVLDERTLTR